MVFLSIYSFLIVDLEVKLYLLWNYSVMNYLHTVLVNFDSPMIDVYSNRSFVLRLLLMDLLDPKIVLEKNCHYSIVDYVRALHLLFAMVNHVLHRVIDYLDNDYFVIYEYYVVDDYLLNYIDFV